jgi:hypothetical protein
MKADIDPDIGVIVAPAGAAAMVAAAQRCIR